ncbi:hypothetical protein [Haloferax gibbonsii]|uniref:hypothetical protein n=1 Tax=Haloferax gibbonsii TaxID=35746 RepID=UPI000AD86E02|nr:hypothetical protein [Haloferax gibbonsii]
MGGFGSGRGRYATTPTVEECRQLSADKLTDVVNHPGTTGTVSWGDSEDSAATIAVVFGGTSDDDHAPYVRLKYTTTLGDRVEEYDYRVGLEYTSCNFGGSRPWFRCPQCNTRRGKLYLRPSGGRFACRECHDLGYQSSRASGTKYREAELRYRRAFAKADAKGRRPHPNQQPYRPERPKGMHHETFERLVDDVDAAAEEYSRRVQIGLREYAQKKDWSLSETGD